MLSTSCRLTMTLCGADEDATKRLRRGLQRLRRGLQRLRRGLQRLR